MKGFLIFIRIEVERIQFTNNTGGILYEKNDFWSSFDAIKQDLEKYIYNWVDIRYYNYCKFKPYNFLGDKIEIMRAIQESENNK